MEPQSTDPSLQLVGAFLVLVAAVIVLIVWGLVPGLVLALVAAGLFLLTGRARSTPTS